MPGRKDQIQSPDSIPEVSQIIFAGYHGLKPGLNINDEAWKQLGEDQNALMQQVLILADLARDANLDPSEAVKIAATFIIASFQRQLARNRTGDDVKKILEDADLLSQIPKLGSHSQNLPPTEAA